MSNPSRRTILAAAVTIPTTAATLALTGGTAHAEYRWDRTLREGMKGSDVAHLQTRVAGWPGYGKILATDGDFGPATAAAVKRFKTAYGLNKDGIAGPKTFAKIYSIQSADNTPIHFTYSELNKCNSTYGGGKAASSSAAKQDARRVMWRLEALRHALGDKPITISSGFRSIACNNAVGGHPDSQHMYGRAADLTGSHSLCTLAKRARYHGFSVILGPGYDGHSDHVHVDIGSHRQWSASRCF